VSTDECCFLSCAVDLVLLLYTMYCSSDCGTAVGASRLGVMEGSRTAAAAGAPAGDDEHLYATGQKGEMVK
jgi:hypothetical protein